MKTISGYVAPLPGGGGGHWQVAIVDGDIEYHVMSRGAGADLIEHLSEQVEVRGIVGETPDGAPCIQVRSYRLIDPDEESWSEE